MRTYPLSLAMGLVLLTAAPLWAQLSEPVDLRPRFVAGRAARYEVWTQRQQTLTLKGPQVEREFSTGLQITGEVIWSVQQVRSDGSATCLMTVQWLAATVTGGDGATQTVDSRRPGPDGGVMLQLLRAMAGTPIKVEMAADGSVRGVSGTESVRAKAGADVTVPEDLDFMESASDLATLVAAPPRATVGTTWRDEQTWGREMGKLRLTTQYRLVSVEEVAGIALAVVEGQGKMRFTAELPPIAADGPRIDLRQTGGSYQTQVMFDLQRHEAVGRNSIETRQMETTIRLNNQTFIRQSHETTQSQTLRVAELDSAR